MTRPAHPTKGTAGPRGPAKPTDFRLTIAGADFRWAGETRPRFPLLQWPDGGLCEPVTAFFGYSTEISRAGTASMRGEAYILREWLSFMLSRGIPWHLPSDALLRQWRESHREERLRLEVEARQAARHQRPGHDRVPGNASRKASVAGVRRVERKIHCVFTFYRLLPKAYGFDDDLKPYPAFVGGDAKGAGKRALTSKLVACKDGKVIEIWVGSQPTDRKPRRRATPSVQNVERILTHLRTKGDAKPSRRRTSTALAQQRLEGERGWLIGASAVSAGLRRDEIAAFALDALLGGLRSEIAIDWPEPPPGVHLLDHVGDDPGCRGEILSALQRLSRRLRRNVFVEVTGKGRGEARKVRKVPFPIEFVEDLLEVGVWGVRREQIRAWVAADPGYVPPPQLFLSFKTKRGMEAGSIGDMLKAAFDAVGVDGSGHRLRAYFATRMAIRLFQERIAQNGFKLDGSVRDWVLERVAEALGHESSRTTIKHYVVLAELEYLGADNRARLAGMAALWDKFLDHATALTPERQALVAAVLQALAQEDDGSSLEMIIRMALDDAGAPAPSPLQRAARTGTARLSLVGGTDV